MALKLGLGKAIEQALDLGVDHIRLALDQKAGALRQALAELPRVKLLDRGNNKGAAVTFAIDGLPCATAKQRLSEQGINIGMNGPGYTPYDMSMRGISELLRASVHLNTTDEDIALIVNAIRSIGSTSL